jgi:hypothetical protein
MRGNSGKGSRRRREDTARVRRNWPWPDRPPPRWDESDPDHPRHRQETDHARQPTCDRRR